MIDWVMDSSHWLGEEGAITLIMQHVVFSVITLGLSLVIAFPVGCYVGHTGRGRVALVGMANALHALPSFELIILLVILCGPLFESDLAFVVPCLVVLMVLALPPIMVGVYSGITAIDPAVIDAAIGIGYSPWRRLLLVEIPCALSLILSGVRSALLQIISTATIAAYVSLGGLGRLIIDGRAQNDYPQMVAGAVLVALLALVTDCLFILLIRCFVSPGLLRRSAKVTMSQRNQPHSQTPFSSTTLGEPEK